MMCRDGDSGFVQLGDLTVAESVVGLLECHGLASVGALLAHANDGQLDKAGLPVWRERLRIDLSDGGTGATTFYLKRYTNPPRSAQRARVRAGAAGHGTAWIEWRWMRRLTDDGIRCVEPVAFGERMEGWRERASVLLTRAVGGVSLERWAHDRATRCPAGMVDALAGFVRRFHELGYVHRDLYLAHVFYDASQPPTEAYRLIDLHRVIKPTWFTERWRVKDLASLNYSTPVHVATVADRVRFLRAYLGTASLGEDGKRLAKRIAGKTRRIARHDARRRTRLGEAVVR